MVGLWGVSEIIKLKNEDSPRLLLQSNLELLHSRCAGQISFN